MGEKIQNTRRCNLILLALLAFTTMARGQSIDVFNGGRAHWWSPSDTFEVTLRTGAAQTETYQMRWPIGKGDPNGVLCTTGQTDSQLFWGPFDADSIVWDGNDFGLPVKTPWNVMFVDANGYPLSEDPNDFTYYQPETAFGIGLDNIAAGTYANNYIQVYSLLDFEPNLFNVTIGRGTDDTATGPNNVTIGRGAGNVLDAGLENTLGGKDAGRYLADSNDNTGWGYKVIGGAGDAVAGEYTQYVVGIYPNPISNKIAAMVTTNNTIVTTWGTNGYFSYYSDEGADGPYYTRVMHQLSDGRILLATDSFSIGGTPAYIADLIMVNADGTLDTTWGNNGFFGGLQGTWQYTNINAILEDNDGNFHIFCQVPAFGGGYYKLSSAGVFISGLRSTNYSVLYAFNGACWADDAKTRIIAVGTPNQILKPNVGYFSANVSAINPVTGTRDDTWTGNIGITGAAKYGAEAPTLLSLYTIERMSDDGFVTYENAGSPCYLHKFIADGSAYDSDWGTTGKLQMGAYNVNMRGACVYQDGDTIYMYSLGDGGKVRINNINGATGVVTSYFDTTVNAGGYVSLTKINDYLFCGRYGTPALQVERWTTALAYVDGINVGCSDVYWIMPDSTTTNPASNNVHRVAAFGAYAASSVVVGADDGLYLGTYSGSRNETDPNRFFLDNLDRGTYLGEKEHGMMYGYFAADPNDQWLNINADVNIPLTLTVGELIATDANITNLTIANFDAGSVIFTDVNGLVTQDNANFNYDDVNNSLSVGADTDVNNVFGRWRMGYIGDPVFADYPVLSHYDAFNSTDFALMQDPGGWTYLNCAAISNIDFCVGGAPVVRINGGGFSVEAQPILFGTVGSEDVEIQRLGTQNLGIFSDYGDVRVDVTGDVNVTSDVNSPKYYVGGAGAYITTDGSTNMTLTDPIAGTKTLKQLGSPTYLYIKATAQAEGDLHLSDGTNWGASKAFIANVRVVTSSGNWDLYLLQNDNGYAANDAVIPARRIAYKIIGNADLLVNMPYKDEDTSAEVHLYYVDQAGADTADIYVMGYSLN